MIDHPEINDSTALWVKSILAEGDLHLMAKGLRREHSGIHGNVQLHYGQFRLGGDQLNLEKDSERTRLANACFKRLIARDILIKATISPEQIGHWLDDFCIDVAERWESERYRIVTYEGSEEPEELERLLPPYIIGGSGTIIFGVPGAGKSYILQTMALCIASGLSSPWQAQQRPVLYVNLERSERSLKIRDYALRYAQNIEGSSEIHYLHGKGASLASVEQKMREFTHEHPRTVVFLDSISRSGLGSLMDDTTGNRFSDLMNSVAETWVAIGHTSWEGARESKNAHELGTIMFRAGEDIGVSLISQAQGNRLGIAMKIVKSNDTAMPAHPEYLALEFAEDYLVGIHKAKAAEFPQLYLVEDEDDFTKVREYLEQVGEDYGQAISEATGVTTSQVSKVLSKYRTTFMVVKREKHRIYYTLHRQDQGGNNIISPIE